jgi:hypothetical protein
MTQASQIAAPSPANGTTTNAVVTPARTQP